MSQKVIGNLLQSRPVTLSLTIWLPLLFFVQLSGCSHSSSRYAHAQDFTPTPLPNAKQIISPTPKREAISSIGNPTSYQIRGVTYFPKRVADGYKEKGMASWYGMKFHGHATSNGERYDVYQMTAAHKTLPLPSYVKVTRTDNQQSIVVRVNDRGPFHPGRIIDLSYAAAVKLGIDQLGTAPVEIEVLAQPLLDDEKWIQIAAVSQRETAERLSRQIEEIVGQDWQPIISETLISKTLSQPLLPASGQRPLYRVRIGPITSDTELQALMDRLDRSDLPKAVVISHD